MKYNDYTVTIGKCYTWAGNNEPCQILYRNSKHLYMLFLPKTSVKNIKVCRLTQSKYWRPA